jgi:hypothetical protein
MRQLAMKHHVLAAALAALGFAASAGGAEQVVAIRAGKPVDVVAGKVLVDQTIIVSGQRISAVVKQAH